MILVKKEYETDLHGFKAWSGGKDTLNELTFEQVESIDEMLSEWHSDGIDETELNDFLWFERDYIAELLGYSDFDELMEHNK